MVRNLEVLPLKLKMVAVMHAPNLMVALVGGLSVLNAAQALQSHFISTHKTLMTTRFDPISFRGKVGGIYCIEVLRRTDDSPNRSPVTFTTFSVQASLVPTSHMKTPEAAAVQPQKLQTTCQLIGRQQCITSRRTIRLSTWRPMAQLCTGLVSLANRKRCRKCLAAFVRFSCEAESIRTLTNLICASHAGFTAGSATRNETDDMLKQHIAFACEGREGTMETIPQGCDKLRTIVEFPFCVSGL